MGRVKAGYIGALGTPELSNVLELPCLVNLEYTGLEKYLGVKRYGRVRGTALEGKDRDSRVARDNGRRQAMFRALLPR